MQNIFTRVASTITMVAYASVAFIAPASNAAEGFYRPQMKDIAGLYTRAAAQAAEKQDINVFINAFGSDVFTKKDTAFVAKSLNPAEMPGVTVDKAVFVVQVAGADPIKIQPIDMDKGLFKINGFEFTWNDKQSVEENVARIQPLAQAKGFSMNPVQKLWDLVVPSSHALSEKAITTIAIAVASVIVVGLIGYFVYKAHKNKLKVDEVKARLDAGQSANHSVLNDPDSDLKLKTQTKKSMSH
ncbi:MAG: hypothetical protein ABIR96_10410 [Bdellovibrionota bacterium]